jgi:hypothetical protein
LKVINKLQFILDLSERQADFTNCSDKGMKDQREYSDFLKVSMKELVGNKGSSGSGTIIRLALVPACFHDNIHIVMEYSRLQGLSLTEEMKQKSVVHY